MKPQRKYLKPQLNRVAWYLSGKNWGFVILKPKIMLVKLILKGLKEVQEIHDREFTMEQIFIDGYIQLTKQLESNKIPVTFTTEFRKRGDSASWMFAGHDPKNNMYFYEFSGTQEG